MYTHKILVVDDEATVARTLSVILQLDGYEVSTASSAKQAIEMLKTEHYHVLTTDMNMPEMDGKELLSEAQNAHPLTKRILISGLSGLHKEVDDLKSTGLIHEFIAKPFNRDVLLNATARLLANDEPLPHSRH